MRWQFARSAHLLALLQLAVRALHEPRGGAHGVVVVGAREGAAQLADLARCLIDGDDVAAQALGRGQEAEAAAHAPALDLLLRQSLDHLDALRAAVSDRACRPATRTRSYSASMSVVLSVSLPVFAPWRAGVTVLQRPRCAGGVPYRARRRALDLNLNDFALDDFRLLLDAHACGESRSQPRRCARGRRRAPMERRKACVSASVLLISNEKISEDASMVNGTSGPSACAMPMAMAVLPVEGCPARRIARPAILPA
jgi:hypothetical protein